METILLITSFRCVTGIFPAGKIRQPTADPPKPDNPRSISSPIPMVLVCFRHRVTSWNLPWEFLTARRETSLLLQFWHQPRATKQYIRNNCVFVKTADRDTSSIMPVLRTARKHQSPQPEVEPRAATQQARDPVRHHVHFALQFWKIRQKSRIAHTDWKKSPWNRFHRDERVYAREVILLSDLFIEQLAAQWTVPTSCCKLPPADDRWCPASVLWRVSRWVWAGWTKRFMQTVPGKPAGDRWKFVEEGKPPGADFKITDVTKMGDLKILHSIRHRRGTAGIRPENQRAPAPKLLKFH